MEIHNTQNDLSLTFLHLNPWLDCTKIIADVRNASGLDARKYTPWPAITGISLLLKINFI
jgi:hypothetical protein